MGEVGGLRGGFWGMGGVVGWKFGRFNVVEKGGGGGGGGICLNCVPSHSELHTPILEP